MPTHTSRPDFLLWVAGAKPGETANYHKGSLMYDRQHGARFVEVNATACAAWDKMEAGEIILTQYKLAGVVEYRATKRAAPFKPVIWFGPYATDKYTKYSKPRSADERKAFAMGCALGHDNAARRSQAAPAPVGLVGQAA